MPYLYLFFSVMLNAMGSIAGKNFNIKNVDKKDTSPFYNLIQIISVFFAWCIVFIIQLDFHWKVLPYSFLFAVFYTLWMVGLINALKTGPVTITTLIMSMSLILTTIWGFFFWNTKITGIVIIGLILVLISMFLCLYSKQKDEKNFSWKWFSFVMLAFFSNAGCSIVQRNQQTNFNGKYGGMFMCFATLLSFFVCLVLYLKSDRSDSKILFQKSMVMPISAGISNALLNLCIIFLATSTLSPSLIYPVIGVGGLVLVILLSQLFFKEKLNKQQIVGIIIGIIATALLSI